MKMFDEYSIEDTQAVVNLFDNIVARTTPTDLATNYALEKYNVRLTINELNRILGNYATTLDSIEICVDKALNL